MVFGLVLTPNKKYSQKVEKDFQISNAALDTKTCGNGETQLMLNVDKNNFLVCTLSKDRPQYSLDIQLSEGETIAFCSVGTGTIHLTGYMLPDQDDLMGGGMMGPEVSDSDEISESEAEEDDSDDSESEKAPKLVPIKKQDLKKKQEIEEEEEEEDSDEDEEDDQDSDEEEEDDSDDDDDDEEEEEVEQPQKKKKLENGLENGIAPKKDKKEQLKHKKNSEKQQPAQQKNDATKENQQQKSGKKTVLQGGVMIEDLKVGDGPEAKPSNKVTVYYEGRLKSNNKVFDSCKSGNGFKFGINRGEVIRGWDIGVAGMKVGGKRRITCPPQMAYGKKGSPPVIPPNSTLVFEVELRHVK